jgi:hypothetical protein
MQWLDAVAESNQACLNTICNLPTHLCDASCLPSRHLGLADVIQQAGLAMVYMTHHCHHRGARLLQIKQQAETHAHWSDTQLTVRYTTEGVIVCMAQYSPSLPQGGEAPAEKQIKQTHMQTSQKQKKPI